MRMIISGFTLILLFISPLFGDGWIDPSYPYGWGENIGWINFEGDGVEGVRANSHYLSGFAWGENIGWLFLGDGSPTGNEGTEYTQNAGDTGVNHDGVGNLSGYAWGENVGWVNFDTSLISGTQVQIDADGYMHGFAWGENIGWINFGNGFGVKLNIGESVGNWSPFYRFIPRDGAAYIEWSLADDLFKPIEYFLYTADVSGGQVFSTPNVSTPGLNYLYEGLSNLIPKYLVVRSENPLGSKSENTNELICIAGPNLISGTIYNHNFEIVMGTRIPDEGKPVGWSASGQDYGDKTTTYYMDDGAPFEGSYCALMTTTGIPVNPEDLSIASLTSDQPFPLIKDHTYAVSAAVRRSDSQWTRFILYSAGFSIIHTESIDALDDQSGDSGWEILYFHFRPPSNLENAYIRIDSIVTNVRTDDGTCSLWLDDVQVIDLGIEGYSDIFSTAPLQYGIRNRYFDFPTESVISTIGGTAYSCSALPRRWNMSMAVDTGSNNASGYPLWSQETPTGLNNTSGNAGYVKARAADTSGPAWPAIAADGVLFDVDTSNGDRHVLSFDYGASGMTLPLLRVFMINNDFSHYSSLFVDPLIDIPSKRMWPLSLHFTPDFGKNLILVRFDNVTLGASGSGAHTDEATLYIDNVWMGVVSD